MERQSLIGPMPRKPYLSHERTRHGRMVWYFKRTGRRIRLPDVYGSPEFNSAYEKALTGTAVVEPKKPQSGTLSWLVGQYMRSSSWGELSPSTRRSRENIFKAILKDNGHIPIHVFTKGHIIKAMESRKKNAANNFLKAVKPVFAFAVAIEKLEKNPCDGVTKVKVKTDGHHTWTVEEVEKYRAKHKIGTMPRLAIDLLLFLGLRRSDVVKVGRQHMQNGVISIKHEKTGAEVHIPVLASLQASISATPGKGLAFLETSTGMPFRSGNSFGNWFKKQVRAAELPGHCTAHGLRKAGATIAANEGATPHELMAMFGWSNLAMAEVYTKKADKIKLARAASERLENKGWSHQ